MSQELMGDDVDLVMYAPERTETPLPMNHVIAGHPNRLRLWFTLYTDERHLRLYASAAAIYGSLFLLWLYYSRP